LIAGLVLVVWREIFQTFFQQDEWSWLGRYIYFSNFGLLVPAGQSIKYGLGDHFAPLAALLRTILIRQFGLDFFPYAVFSLFFHILNSFLIFYLTFLLTKRRDMGILAGFLFAVSSIPYNAIIWISNSIWVLPALFFSLLSLIFFLIYLERKKTKELLLFLIFFWISLFFKEIGVFIFLLVPFYLWISFKKDFFSSFGKIIKILLANGFGYLLMIVLADILTRGSRPVGTFNKVIIFPSFAVLVYQFLTLPFKTLSQAFIYPKQIFAISGNWLKLAYPADYLTEGTTRFGLIREGVGAELISYFLAIVILFVFNKILKELKKTKNFLFYRGLIFGFLILILGGFPFVPLAFRGPQGIVQVMRSGDLYFPVVGASLMLAISLIFFLESLFKEKKIFVFIFSFLFFIGFFIYHYSNLHKEVFPEQIKRAQQRKNILFQIIESYPNLPDKVVFYTKSNAYYYGHSEASLPFQTGFGRSLLLWYSFYIKNFPWEYFKDNFLYLFNEEGYREIGNKGFGYFHNFEKLKEVIEKYNLPLEAIYAFSWEGDKNELSDITQEVRKSLRYSQIK